MLHRLLDPSTSTGTARWVALGVAGYDLIARGANAYNVGALLVLGGLLEATRFLSGGNGSGPTPSAPAPVTA